MVVYVWAGAGRGGEGGGGMQRSVARMVDKDYLSICSSCCFIATFLTIPRNFSCF